MTSDETIAKELFQLFKFLQPKETPAQAKEIKFNTLVVSQFNMIDVLTQLIDNEISKAQRGEPALIRIKVNNLEDPGIIDQLYKAGKAGVTINMVVRSICCLVPGVPGESNNIQVKSIVDRFLEHSRILIFGNDQDATILIGSADLMIRNLHHRIEAYVHINDQNCKKELLKYFDIQWQDNDKAVTLLQGYAEVKAGTGNAIKINAQQSIYNFLASGR
jgi:polyphosphate kinase